MMKYLRVANVYTDRLELDDVAEIGVTKDEFEHLKLQPGDLLVVEGNGSVEQIGRVAVWRGELEEVGHQNHLIRVRLKPGMCPRFFLSFLMSPLGRDLIVRQASSTSGLHTLSISKVAALPVPVPSPKEQKALVEALAAPMSEIDKQAEEIDIGLAKCSALRQSILKRAFSGQLVGQDPRDEPATALFERIRAERNAASEMKTRNGKNRYVKNSKDGKKQFA
jgi:type I restriction enzyme S subunit